MDKFIVVVVQVTGRQLDFDLGSAARVVFGISAVVGSASRSENRNLLFERFYNSHLGASLRVVACVLSLTQVGCCRHGVPIVERNAREALNRCGKEPEVHQFLFPPS